MDNYEKLVDRISRSSALGREEIERKIEAKKAKLSGLISREGAAQIVAAELGINFEQEKMKLSELVEGMKKVNVVGKIVQLNPVRNFNKNGREGKVASFVLADESSNVRAVLWDVNHISLIEKEDIKNGSVIEISNASMRNGELHLSSFSDVKKSKEIMENVVQKMPTGEKKLVDSKTGDNVKIRGLIVKAFEPRYFEVCPECGKKVVDDECKTHGKTKPQKRALLTLVIDDGSETIRSVAFMEQIYSLGLKDDDIFSLDEFNKVKDTLLGEEKYFIGQLRSNALYNTTEFSIAKIENVEPDILIKELESKM